LARARRQGTKLGRRRERISVRKLERVAGLSVRKAAKALGVPASRIHRELARLFQHHNGLHQMIAEKTNVPDGHAVAISESVVYGTGPNGFL